MAELVGHHQAVAEHYDIDSAFYELWLDPTMTYSCALWGEGDDLLAAQQRKLDHHLRAVAQHAGDGHERRLLDIGCGWGAAQRRAVEVHGFRSAIGLTVSASQASYVERHPVPGVTSLVQPWEAHEPVERYEGVVSIGAFEHVAASAATADERMATYRRFFASVHSWLQPRGAIGLQTIVNENASVTSAPSETALGGYLGDSIFGGSALPRFVEVVTAADPWFEIESVRLDGADYARTCSEWRRRLIARESEARAIAGPEVTAEYLRYLGVAGKSFKLRWCNLARMVLVRRHRPLR